MDPGISTIISAFITSIGNAFLFLANFKNDTQKIKEPTKSYGDEASMYIHELNIYIEELEKKLKKSRKVSIVISVISFIFAVYFVICFVCKNNFFNTENADNPYQAPVCDVPSNIPSIESATIKSNTITIKIKIKDLFSNERPQCGIILYSPQSKTPYNGEKVIMLKVTLSGYSYSLKTQVVIAEVNPDGYHIYEELDNYSKGAVHNDVCELAFDITNDYTDTEDIYIHEFINSWQ